MSPEEERWAEALAVQRVHGGRTALDVAERIGALASVGEQPGVRRWLGIAQRIDRLSTGAAASRHH